MKKLVPFLILFFAVMGTVMAQTPMFFNTNAAGGANVFPFGSATNKVQWCIPAGSLGSITPGNNITTVYFQTGSTATNTYPIINISLKTGTSAGLTGTASGPWEPGMTLVYTGTGVLVTTTVGQWFGFTLTTPWLYDPTLPLFVEVETNATTGRTVYQAVAITGPGNGRQWGNFGSTTINGTGNNQVNFGVDIIPATPCTGAPPSNTLFPSTFTACAGFANPSLSLTATYSLGGLNYQWQSSTVSPVGPFTSITGATLSTAPIPTLGITTWYQAIVTCTNPGGASTTIPPSQYFVGSTITGSIPYYEDFESIQVQNRLPNCSWWTTNLGSSVTTYTNAASNNRIANSGQNFASFGLPSSNNYVYTHGLQMEPGITYSANIWYTTEYFGYNNWSNLSLSVGSSQTPTGLNLIASTSPAISGPYKSLGGTFTVATSGLYYVAVCATASNGNALYLSWDDLSVTIPCTAGSGNSPTVSISAASTTICAGSQVNINANGADSYMWSNGATTSAVLVSPANTTTYTVVGTNSVTGCSTSMTQVIHVNPSPNVFAVMDKEAICPGQSSYISAYGALSYAWSTGGTGNVISVSPNTTTTYSVIGTNANGCSNTGTVVLTVKTKPTISAISGNTGDACAGESVVLTANGGASYLWYSSSSSVLLSGNPVNVPVFTTTTFTVVGTATNDCSSAFTVNQSVVPCTGLEKLQGNIEGLQVFPNPATTKLNVELASGNINLIVITDVAGRVVLTTTPNSTQVELDIHNLASGVYFAKITTDNVSEVIRLVKN